MANWTNNAEKETGPNTTTKSVNYFVVFMTLPVVYASVKHKTQNNFVEPIGSPKVFK